MRTGRFYDSSGDDAPALPDTAVLRVLWMTAQGMVWPWLLQSMCRGDAIEHALRAELIWAPVGEHLGYHITDAGRRRIVDWYQRNKPGGDADDAQQWRAVTLR
ncbi:hypothetical protein [Nocardia sp. NRRL S-836]|uniref:hypothetical protein n=1 Tax=Nocardia sp. NRRL S-836 TaxID=1519492 RepID=UPI0006ADA6F8|nr:hypothetical protein [Nocardia sp. NRRL S-836]KOV83154.1 hypothetical protein ADL03_21605 [Nocardia sp. NRRL S-836]